MYTKRIISILVALGLLAVSSVPVFADDTTNAGTSNTTGTATTTDTATPNTDPANTGTNTDPGTPVTPGTSSTVVPKDKPFKEIKAKEVDLVCMQTAVEKRDNAIIAGLDTYYTNVKAALVARRDALKAAWGMTDRKARQEAIRKAWNDFKGTWKKERRALDIARKKAWKEFNKDKRACNGQGEGEDQGNDANL